MRQVLGSLLLVATLSAPRVAASSAVLPYNLVFSPRPTSETSNGAIVGQIGGVPVAGTYRGNGATGTLTLTVHQATFMDATYTCSPAGCKATGTVAGKRVTSMSLSSLGGVGQAMSIAFPSRGAWISTVTEWARASLGADWVPEVVDGASTVNIFQASNDPVPVDRLDRKGESGGGSSGGGGGGNGGGGGMMH